MAIRRAAVLSIALAAGSAAACGDGDEANTTAGGAAVADTTVAAQPSAAPTVETEFPLDLPLLDGRTVTIPARPEAIVSLSAATTEILYAIGAGSQVVATDLNSNYPPEAEGTAKLDGFNPSVEAITAASPDLVIVYFDPGGVVDGLEAVGLSVVTQPAPADLEGVYTQIGELGAATGHVAEAAALVADMRARITATVSAAPLREIPATYYHELDPTFFTITSNTFLGSVYGLLALENIADAANAGDYPQLSQELIVSSDPDLILLADVKCCGQDAAAVAARPGWESMAAVTGGHVVELDDDVASRPGPRVTELLEEVAAALELVP